MKAKLVSLFLLVSLALLACPAWAKFMVAEDMVTVMSGPGAQYNATGFIYPDKPIWAGEAKDGYLPISSHNKTQVMGYVKEAALRPVTGEELKLLAESAPKPAPVAVAQAAAPKPAPVAVAQAAAPKPAPVAMAQAAAPKPAPVAVAQATAPKPAPVVDPAVARPAMATDQAKRMASRGVSSVLAGRGVKANVKAYLYEDQVIWVDDLQDGFYAVFADKKSASLGYVQSDQVRELTAEEMAPAAKPEPAAPVQAKVVAATPAASTVKPEPVASAAAPAPAAKAEPVVPAAKPVASVAAPAAKPEPAAPVQAKVVAATPAASAAKPQAMQEAPAPVPAAAPGTVAMPVPPQTAGLPTPLSLGKAIAYALEHNLEAAVALQERVIQEEVYSGAKWAMMPNLILEAERSWKDRDTPVSSENAFTHEQSLAPSISADRTVRKESATLSWDLLNLGINIFRWQQAGTQVDIRQKRLERARQDVALEVTRTFMMAVVAQEAADSAEGLINRFLERHKATLEQNKSRITKEVVKGLEDEAHYLSLMLRWKEWGKRSATARAELARSLGVRDPKLIVLEKPNFQKSIDMAPVDVDKEWQKASKFRPELASLDLEHGISGRDATIALMRLYPTPTIFGRFDHDENTYLTEHEWFTVGLRISWDLFSLPRNFSERSAALARQRLVDKRKDSMGLAIYTQLRLASIELKDTQDNYGLVKDLADTRQKLMDAVRQQMGGKGSKDDLLDAEQKYLAAKIDFLSAYARYVTARARLVNTIGEEWKGNI